MPRTSRRQSGKKEKAREGEEEENQWRRKQLPPVAEYTPGIGVDDNDSFVISQIIFVSYTQKRSVQEKGRGRERERERERERNG